MVRRRVPMAVEQAATKEDEARALFRMSREAMVDALRAMNAGDSSRVRDLVNEATRNASTASRLGERFESAMRQAAHFEQQAERVRTELEGAGDQRRELATLEEVPVPAGAHVYFIIEEGGAFIRIGRGSAGKMPSQAGGCPRRLTFVAAMDGSVDEETRIGELFKAERVAGEWFAVSERLAAFVLEVRYGEDVSWMMAGAAA